MPIDYKKRAEEFEKMHGQGQAEEQGIQEGDITDYIYPVKGLAKKALRKIAEKGSKTKGGVIVKKIVDKKKPTKAEQDAKREAAHEAIAKEQSKQTRLERLKKIEEEAPTLDYSKFK